MWYFKASNLTVEPQLLVYVPLTSDKGYVGSLTVKLTNNRVWLEMEDFDPVELLVPLEAGRLVYGMLQLLCELSELLCCLRWHDLSLTFNYGSREVQFSINETTRTFSWNFPSSEEHLLFENNIYFGGFQTQDQGKHACAPMVGYVQCFSGSFC